MPNSNPEAILVSTKMRQLADIEQRRYWILKSLQLQANQQNWIALFPNDADTIDDGADTDGREVITNAEVRSFMLDINQSITDLEANTNQRLNYSANIAVNPQGKLGGLAGD